MVEDIQLQISLFQHYKIPSLPLHSQQNSWKKAAWKSPYVIKEVHTNNSVTLLGKNQQALRKKMQFENVPFALDR